MGKKVFVIENSEDKPKPHRKEDFSRFIWNKTRAQVQKQYKTKLIH